MVMNEQSASIFLRALITENPLKPSYLLSLKVTVHDSAKALFMK